MHVSPRKRILSLLGIAVAGVCVAAAGAADRSTRTQTAQPRQVNPAPPGDEAEGTVIAADSAGIIVRCGHKTAVLVTDVQREGRRRMPADAFLIGERVSPGERFG